MIDFLLIIIALALCVNAAILMRLLQMYIRFHYETMNVMRPYFVAGPSSITPTQAAKMGPGEIVRTTAPMEKKRGSVFIPPDAADEAREEIIERNRAAGIDTKLEDLYKDHEN